MTTKKTKFKMKYAAYLIYRHTHTFIGVVANKYCVCVMWANALCIKLSFKMSL